MASILGTLNTVSALLGGSDSFNGAATPSSGPFQSFATIPVANTRIALYALSIRSSTGEAYETYTFPLSPGSLVKEHTSLSNSWNVAGTPQQNGVQREIDVYGDTPATFHLEGTTGWQTHSTDGFAYNGIDSILQLEKLLSDYAQLNATAVAAGNPLYTLEFYDYFKNDFWQVQPMGRQEFRQVKDRPLLISYSLHWEGVVDLSAPPSSSSSTTLFGSNANSSLSSLNSSVSGTVTDYEPNTPGASSLVTAYA